MRRRSVLVVDDSAQMVATLARYLQDHAWDVHTALGGAEALDVFARERVDVVLTDLRMKGADGIDVLEEIRRADEHIPVILMTAFGSVESAVDAIQRGAYNYVRKPFEMVTVRVLLERAVKERQGRPTARDLPATAYEPAAFRDLVGTSPAMRELVDLVDRVARTSTPVLIAGEMGTGKELLARAIHRRGGRHAAPFVTASCTTLPEATLESELFGAVAGTSSAAPHARPGLFVEADGGTLFLDEVADLPLPLQGRLLRVLEGGEIRAVGDDASRRVDVRCIASTRADLAALVRARRFREDLFFRLSVLPIRVAPLRERHGDLPLLVDHFLTREQERTKDPTRRRLTPEALRVLEAHAWPGNVGELETVVQRLVVMVRRVEIDDDAVRAALKPLTAADPTDALAAAHLSLADVEDRYVDAVLRHSRGSKSDAAAILGIDLSTLYRRRARQRRR